MAKVWVLETHTKGTGANLVPLERTLKRPGAETEPFVLPELKPRPHEEPAPQQPHIFKVIDVRSREVLCEGVDARAAVNVLADVRSVVDVAVYVWQPQGERWRILTFGEMQVLWDYRRRLALQPPGIGDRREPGS